jgi:hypothetical protein
MKVKINQKLFGADGVTPISDKKGTLPMVVYKKMISLKEDSVLNLNYNEVKECLDSLEGEHPLTLRDVCVNSLLTPMDGDDEIKKYEKWEIFKKLRDLKSKDDTIELKQKR